MGDEVATSHPEIRPRAAARHEEEVDDFDYSDSDDMGRAHRYNKRGKNSRNARSRKTGNTKRKRPRADEREEGAGESTYWFTKRFIWKGRDKAFSVDVICPVPPKGVILHLARIALFCAMAWSLKSILFSVARLAYDQ